MANIAIIDDDEMICKSLASVVHALGHNALSTYTLTDGLEMVGSANVDVVFLDVNLPDGNGLSAVDKVRQASSLPEVIIITGIGDPDGAAFAMKTGAWDYIEKPLEIEAITVSLSRVLEYRRGKGPQFSAETLKVDFIVGKSPSLKRCLDLVARSARTDLSVLITGETGTGKELFARAVHENSCRAGRDFVVVDCAALPGNLVESILFGHEKGAFTGASEYRRGLVGQADGGTLFLDEVGELPLPVQGAFLRVLQEHCYRCVGGALELHSDFRLVAATNRDLDAMVEAGEFRRDLLFRLRSAVIELPPLRGRKEDVKELAAHFMNRLCDRHHIGTKRFSPEFAAQLVDYGWPGNIRELAHAVETAFFAAHGEQTLFPIHLPESIRIHAARSYVSNRGDLVAPVDQCSSIAHDLFRDLTDYRTFLEKTERAYFQSIISSTSGNMEQICRISGLSRANVYRHLKKHNIVRHF